MTPLNKYSSQKAGIIATAIIPSKYSLKFSNETKNKVSFSSSSSLFLAYSSKEEKNDGSSIFLFHSIILFHW